MYVKHKFHAIRVEYDDIKFGSKKESKRYLELKALQKSGDVVFFLRQVPFHLPGKVKYLCDFLTFWVDGTVTIEDVKGYATKEYKIKKRLVESIYPIKITEI